MSQAALAFGSSADSESSVYRTIGMAGIEGFAEGFMAGGILAGISQTLACGFRLLSKLGIASGRKGGINLGKLKILSPNNTSNPNIGGTLIKYQNKVRIDVEIGQLLHAHTSATGRAHIPAGTIVATIRSIVRRRLRRIRRSHRRQLR